MTADIFAAYRPVLEAALSRAIDSLSTSHAVPAWRTAFVTSSETQRRTSSKRSKPSSSWRTNARALAALSRSAGSVSVTSPLHRSQDQQCDVVFPLASRAQFAGIVPQRTMGRAGVIDEPLVALSKLARSQINHGVERHALAGLTEENQVAWKRGFQIALIAGDTEFASGVWKVKQLQTRTETTAPEQELVATIFHALGVPPDATIPGPTGEPVAVYSGRPIAELF